MNIRASNILSIFLSTLALSVAEDLTWLYGGVDSFQDCSERNQVVRGLCGSGNNRDCKRDSHKSYSSVGCGGFPSIAQDESNGNKRSEVAITKTLNGWKCVKFGIDYTCKDDPDTEGDVVVGVCGSGRRQDCREYCNPWTHSAIKCGISPVGQGVDSESGDWSKAQKFGTYFQCKANEVVCGACQSGKRKDCNGGHFRVRCCKVGNYDIIGRWNYVRTIVGETTETLTHGTTKTVKETMTNTWSKTVTRSVGVGLEVKGIGPSVKLSIEVSTSYAHEYSEEWSSKEETEFTFVIDEKESGKALWQWEFDITDPFNNKVVASAMDYALTEGKNRPPRCQPGFSAGVTVDYQHCTSDDRILPGFHNVTMSLM